MPKLNVGYQSLFETVAVQKKDKTYLPFLSDIFYLVDFTFYKTENDRIYYSENAHVPYGRRYNPYPHRNPYLMQLLGGLQPMDDLAKKVIDIFKPYKAKRDPSFVKEILQFLLGLMRIFKGVITLLMAPLFFGVYTIKYLTSPKTFFTNMRDNMVKTTSWMLEGLSNLIVGNIEMLSSPLSLLVKLPMRAILVWIKGLPTIEENKGTRFLVSRAERIIENLKNYQEEELKTQDINITEASHPLPVKMQMHELHAICYRLNEKTKKAQNYDQKMRQLKIEDIDSTLVEDLLEKKTTSLKSMEDFLGLFSLNSNKKANGINHYKKTNIPSHT